MASPGDFSDNDLMDELSRNPACLNCRIESDNNVALSANVEDFSDDEADVFIRECPPAVATAAVVPVAAMNVHESACCVFSGCAC